MGNQKPSMEQNHDKYENKKLLKNPKLQKYLSLDVVERLINKQNKEILYKSPNKNKKNNQYHDEQKNVNPNDKRLSESELEQFIERQKQHEMFRKKRIQKLCKQFNVKQQDEEEEEHGNNIDVNTKKEEKENNENNMSYIQLFNHQKQGKKQPNTSSSYSSLSKMHCETQFVSM